MADTISMDEFLKGSKAPETLSMKEFTSSAIQNVNPTEGKGFFRMVGEGLEKAGAFTANFLTDPLGLEKTPFYQPGKQIIPSIPELPRSGNPLIDAQMDVARGVGNAGLGMTTPGMALIAPAAGLEGTAARMLAGYFGAQGIANTPAGLAKAGKDILDPKVGFSDKVKSATEGLANPFIGVLGARGALHETGLPSYEGNVPKEQLSQLGTTQHPVGENGSIGKLQDVLQRVGDNTKSAQSQVAKKLLGTARSELLQSDVVVDPTITKAAAYDPQTKTIRVHPEMINQDFPILHEAVHALTEEGLRDPQTAQPLEESRQRMVDRGNQSYGSQDVNELIAEAMTNPGFQQRLKFERGTGERSVPARIGDSLLSLIGRAREGGSMLEQVREQAEPLLRQEQRAFGPERAPEVPLTQDDFLGPRLAEPKALLSFENPRGPSEGPFRVSPQGRVITPDDWSQVREGVRPSQEPAPIIGAERVGTKVETPQFRPEDNRPAQPEGNKKGPGGKVFLKSAAENAQIGRSLYSGVRTEFLDNEIKRLEERLKMNPHPNMMNALHDVMTEKKDVEAVNKTLKGDKVIKVGVKTEDGSVISGRWSSEARKTAEGAGKKVVDVGFVTEKGKFVVRPEKKLYSGVELGPEHQDPPEILKKRGGSWIKMPSFRADTEAGHPAMIEFADDSEGIYTQRAKIKQAALKNGLSEEQANQQVERILPTPKKALNSGVSLPRAQREQEILKLNDVTKPLTFNRKVKAQPGESLSLLDSARNQFAPFLQAAKKLLVDVSPKDVLYDWLDGGQGKYSGTLSKEIHGPLDDAWNNAYNLNEKESTTLRQQVSAEKIDLKNSQRIDTYIRAKTTEGYNELITEGVKPAKIQEIQNNITPAEQKVASEIEDIYDRTHARLQQVASKALAKGEVPGAGESSSDVGAVAKVQRYLTDYSHFVESSKLTDDILSIVNKPEFAKKYGEMGQMLVREDVKNYQNQGRYRHDKIVDMLRRNVGTGVISWRLPSQIVHTANIPLAIGHIGPQWWSRGIEEAISSQGKDFLRKNFGETFARGGGEPALADIVGHEAKGPIRKAVKNVTDAGFWIQRQIDQINAQATTIGAYMKLLEEKGIDPKQYHSIPPDVDSIQKARILSRRAVASPIYKDTPAILSRGGSYSKMFFQFQNTFLDQFSNISYDLLHAGVDRAIAKDPTKFLITAAALAGMLLTETTVKFGYKKSLQATTGSPSKEKGSLLEQFGSDLVKESLKRVPGMGQLMTHLLYGGTGIPAVDVLSDDVKQVNKAVNEGDERARTVATHRAEGAIGETLGIPGSSQITDVRVARDRAKYFKSHVEKVEGKDAEEQPIAKRIVSEYKYQKPKTTTAEDAKAGEFAMAANEKRREELKKSLSKADQNWLDSRQLKIRGFDNRIGYNKEDDSSLDKNVNVYLTDNEQKKYAGFVKQGYEIALKDARENYDSKDDKEKEKYFAELNKEVHDFAKGKMKEWLASDSKNESNEKKGKRFSIFTP